MIYITAIIKTKAQYRSEVTNVLQQMVRETRKESDCIQYDLHQDQHNKDLFIFYEIWKDQAGLDKHNQQPYILDFGQLVHEKLQETPQIYLTNKI